MKTIKLFLLATLFAISFTTQAQVSVNVNLGKPPIWAPKNAEPVKYYYLPEIETYYDVPSKRYIYMRNGSWFRSASLPAQYRNYDLYKGQTVYINDYKGKYPYSYFKQHKVKYYKGNNSSVKLSNGNGNYKGNHNGNENKHNNGNKHKNKGKDKK